MYGGYRDAKGSVDSSNPSVPTSATTNTNRLRSLRSLSGITQPVRTRDLLEELREVYDDIDNSASKRPINPPEDDPLISWDKHSLPKGLEWMKPTPSKNRSLNPNTIPETVSNFHNREVDHCKAGLLSTGETQKSSSSVCTVEKSKAVPEDLMKLDSDVQKPASPAVLNEFDKENVFVPLKTNSEILLQNHHGLLSSTKKSLPTDVRSEGEPYHLNTDLIHRTVQKEDLFTPLKKVKVDSTLATVKHVSAHPSHKISSIPENALPTAKLSPPDDHLHNLMSGRKSPLNMQPHLSLLTPITHVRSTGSALSYSKKSAFSSLAVPLDNHHSIKPDNLDIWMTPAKGHSHVAIGHEESKLGKSSVQLSYAVPLEENCKGEENNVKLAEDRKPVDVLSLKSNAPKVLEEVPQIEEQNHPMKMASFPRNVQHGVVSSCLSTPISLTTPAPAPILKLLSRSTSEMPPPLPEVRKQPIKSSPESVPPATNHSIGSTLGGKKSTNEQIYVNGKTYTVLSLLGRGGSSVVYLVLEPVTSNLMAVKCVNLSELDQSTYEGYLNEIKLLAQLQDSDCVIRMFDHQHCKEEKLLYVVMEKGETDLSKLIREVSRTKKISPAMIVYYWTEMLNAVSFIHKKGTIHSDLKPANFLLVAGRLKLIDFGIASSIQADMTSVVKDTMTGTYNYISPEALCSTGSGPDGRSMRFKISYKSDVWSLGCILYNLVYGHTPFQTITHQFTKMKAIADPKHKIPFPPAPGCPQALLQAMQACLVRDPKHRPSVDDLLKYPYLGSVEQLMTEKLSGLLDQINTVTHSTQTPSEKILSIQSLLSTMQTSRK